MIKNLHKLLNFYIRQLIKKFHTIYTVYQKILCWGACFQYNYLSWYWQWSIFFTHWIHVSTSLSCRLDLSSLSLEHTPTLTQRGGSPSSYQRRTWRLYEKPSGSGTLTSLSGTLSFTMDSVVARQWWVHCGWHTPRIRARLKWTMSIC